MSKTEIEKDALVIEVLTSDESEIPLARCPYCFAWGAKGNLFDHLENCEQRGRDI